MSTMTNASGLSSSTVGPWLAAPATRGLGSINRGWKPPYSWTTVCWMVARPHWLVPVLCYLATRALKNKHQGLTHPNEPGRTLLWALTEPYVIDEHHHTHDDTATTEKKELIRKMKKLWNKIIQHAYQPLQTGRGHLLLLRVWPVKNDIEHVYDALHWTLKISNTSNTWMKGLRWALRHAILCLTVRPRAAEDAIAT